MRDFSEQRKSFWRGLILFIIITAYVLLLFFGVGIKITNDFLIIKVYNVETDSTLWKNNSLVVSQYKTPTEGSRFIYKVNINGVDNHILAKYVSNDGTTYHLLDYNDKPYTETLTTSQLYGIPLMIIPAAGKYIKLLQSTTGMIILIGASVFVLITIMIAIYASKRRRNKGHGPGLNYKRFNSEDAFIYSKLTNWLKKNGFKIDLGDNCEYILIQGNTKKGVKTKLFGVITYEYGSIYVKINHNFNMDSEYYTRDGYIKIERAMYLDDAKQRIKKAYFSFFKKAKTS